MRKIIYSFLVGVFIITFFSKCSFFNKTSEINRISTNFFENLIQKKYDLCVSDMDTDSIYGNDMNADTLRNRLPYFRKSITENFGENFEFKVTNVKQRFLKSNLDTSFLKSTFALVQVKNSKKFCIYKITFNENLNKIISIEPPTTHYDIPNMYLFYSVGIIAIIIIGFIVLTLIKIHKSQVKNKWIYYLISILVSAPTLIYSAINGFSIHLFYIEFSFGVSANFNSYLNDVWKFGLPIGAIASRYMIYRDKSKKENEQEYAINSEGNQENNIIIDTIKEVNFSTHSYKCEDGVLSIEQEFHYPNIGENVLLNGKTPPDYKYKIGFMSYVEVENGKVAAVSSF